MTTTTVAGGCGPIIEQAPFPARPDSVRPGDMLGPYDGVVVDGDTDRPIGGAVVAASWAFERGFGAQGPLDAREVVTETDADGRYAIPELARLPTGLSARVRRFTLVVYKRGYIGWRSDRIFPGRERRRDFCQRLNKVRLDRWQSGMVHLAHLMFLGGGAKVRAAAAWEIEAAGGDVEGQSAEARGVKKTKAAPALLDITTLLSDDEVRGVTGYVGKFVDERLADLPTTEFYDSRHFKAEGRAESYDVALRVWRLGAAAAEVQYQKLQEEVEGANGTDEIGDASFRARSVAAEALVFLMRERGVVISLTCGKNQCTEKSQIVRLGKLVESRIPDLPPPAVHAPDEDATDGAGREPGEGSGESRETDERGQPAKDAPSGGAGDDAAAPSGTGGGKTEGKP